MQINETEISKLKMYDKNAKAHPDEQVQKIATSIKGGNTDEIYKNGTFEKSKQIVAMHPDVCKLAWRFNRWHHYCDYLRFRVNKPILKDDIKIKKGHNEYGMLLRKIK